MTTLGILNFTKRWSDRADLTEFEQPALLDVNILEKGSNAAKYTVLLMVLTLKVSASKSLFRAPPLVQQQPSDLEVHEHFARLESLVMIHMALPTQNACSCRNSDHCRVPQQQLVQACRVLEFSTVEY